MMTLSPEQFNTFAGNIFLFHGSIDADGEIVSSEGSALERLGINPKSMTGENFMDLSVWNNLTANKTRLKTGYDRAREGKMSTTRLTIIGRPTETIHIELILFPDLSDTDKHIFFGARDITTIQTEIDQLKDRCDQLLFAAEASETGLWYQSFGKDEIYSSPACNALFDFPTDETLTFKKLLGRLHPKDRAKFKKNFGGADWSEPEFSIKFRIVRKDGNTIWVAAKGKTFFDPGKRAKGILGSVHNINDEKAVSEQLESIYAREKDARDSAEFANKTKDFFLAVVSHELRSPLNSILGWTNILLTDDVDEEVRRTALESIKRGAETQAKLIDDLLDSARVTSGNLTLEISPVNVSTLLDEIIDSHHPLIEEKEIELEYNNQIGTLETYADPNRLRQVFANLLGNAIKFTSKGGKISVSLNNEAGDVIVAIRDDGQGIAEEDMPLIFQRFIQGDMESKGVNKGLGLGLPLAKILIEKHGGEIKVHSDGPDRGAEFTVVFPIQSKQVDEERLYKDEVSDLQETFDNTLEGVKILVLEDDDDSRHVLGIFLDQMGADTNSVESVAEAVAYLDDTNHSTPDLIISDIAMPGEDGYSFVTRLRESNRFSKVPAIALSAFTAEKNKSKALKLGFNCYLTKPFDPDLLKETIIELIKPD
ncbi:MAG: response regulator [Pyrinomonadaceae bacterium]|nr:response regulator [Pyrinomonadaceae bacterium]